MRDHVKAVLACCVWVGLFCGYLQRESRKNTTFSMSFLFFSCSGGGGGGGRGGVRRVCFLKYRHTHFPFRKKILAARPPNSSARDLPRGRASSGIAVPRRAKPAASGGRLQHPRCDLGATISKQWLGWVWVWVRVWVWVWVVGDCSGSMDHLTSLRLTK